MARKWDLYRPQDLEKRVGEFNNLDEVKRFYLKFSGVCPAPKQSAQSLSASYAIPEPRRHDVDMIEILDACLEEHGIKHVWRYQKRGTCVGQSAATAADIVMSMAWLVMNKKYPGRAAVATSYAGSRVEVAGQPGNWDGSNGSWVAEFVTRWGVSTLNDIGLENEELDQDERLAVSWTASRNGIPEKFEEITKSKPIVKAPLVTSARELIALMESGNPVVDCSNLIPVDRDTDDVVPLRKEGGHATVFGGIRWVNGESQIKYVNSWSRQYGRDGCVWISLQSAVRILDQGDSYAFVGIQGLSPAAIAL